MLVFGALIFAISYYIFLFRKSITGALVVSGALISIYMIYFHQVVFDVFYSYPDVDKMISYATIVIIIIASKMIVDKYLQNEVGFDLTYLGNKLFPNYHFKLFALYFVGLLFISEKIYLLVITLYFLSNILRIKPAYSYVIITLSLITNLIFRAEALVPAIPDLDYYTSLELTNIVHLFGVFAIFLAFIFITSVNLISNHGIIKDIKTIFSTLRKDLLILFVSFLIIFEGLNIIFTIQNALVFSSFVMIFLCSFISRKTKINRDQRIDLIPKNIPFFLSLLVFIFNWMILFLINYFLYISLAIFIVGNIIIIRFLDNEHIQFEIKTSKKFPIKILALFVLLYLLETLYVNSGVNNLSMGFTVEQEFYAVLANISNPLSLIVFALSINPFVFLYDITNFLGQELDYTLLYLLIFYNQILAFISIPFIYFIHQIIELNDQDTRDTTLTVVAYCAILITFLIIVVST